MLIIEEVGNIVKDKFMTFNVGSNCRMCERVTSDLAVDQQPLR